MEKMLGNYRGCLLGMAIGDAMGYTIDGKTWDEIQENYGPNGLLGYDLKSDYAEITSYTQLAAYICNALLLSVSRGKGDKMLEFANLGLREWTRSQQFARDPEKSYCWVAKLPAFRRRHCRDARMLDTLRFFNHEFMNKLHIILGYLQTGDYGYALKLGVAAGSATAFSMAAVRSSARSRLLAALYSQFTEGERIRNETLKTRISFSLLMAKQRGRGPSVSDWSHYT